MARASARARALFRKSFGRVVRERLQRAQLAAELAGRALDPVEPLRSGPSVSLALSLDREAAYWALLAQDARYDARDLAGAIAAVPHDVLVYAAGDEHELVEVRSALVEQTFIDSAAEPIDIVMRKAKTVRAFVDALIERAAGPAQQAERLLLERWLRVSMLLVSMVAAVAIGASYGIDATRGPDLAAGKPWKASSKAGDCDAVQRRCLGVATAILFHTVEEENPWYEVDLGSPAAVQRGRGAEPDRLLPRARRTPGGGSEQRRQEVHRGRPQARFVLVLGRRAQEPGHRALRAAARRAPKPAPPRARLRPAVIARSQLPVIPVSAWEL